MCDHYSPKAGREGMDIYCCQVLKVYVKRYTDMWRCSEIHSLSKAAHTVKLGFNPLFQTAKPSIERYNGRTGSHNAKVIQAQDRVVPKAVRMKLFHPTVDRTVSPKRYVLTPCTCECDVIWKEGLCRHNQVKVRPYWIRWALAWRLHTKKGKFGHRERRCTGTRHVTMVAGIGVV